MIQAKLSDIKIGVNLMVDMGYKKEHMIFRDILIKKDYAKNKLSKWCKVETEEEYREYKRIIKQYVKNGFVYI